MKKFFILVQKEVRELLTPYMLIPLVITILMFAFLGKIVGKEVNNAKSAQRVAVVDLDKSVLSKSIMTQLDKSGFLVTTYPGAQDSAVAAASGDGQTLTIVFPAGFSNQVNVQTTVNLPVVNTLRSFAITNIKQAQTENSVLAIINGYLSDSALANKLNLSEVKFAKAPTLPQEYIRVGDKQAQISLTEVTSFIQSQTYFIPIILFIVIIFASQMIATAMATEKENKTLETLLSAPVSRQAIVGSKLVGAGLVSLLFALVYMFGYRYFMNGASGGVFTSPVSPQAMDALHQLGLTFTPFGYLMLGISLFFGILCALSLSLILGGFAEDVKSVQGVVTPLMILVSIPYFLTMFLDFSTLSPAAKFGVYAIPFAHPFLASQFIFLNRYMPVVWGIVYQAVVCLILVWIASRIFSTDYIVTMRWNFSKKKVESR